MKKLNFYLFCILLTINIGIARSQCAVSAGSDQTITPDGAIQLNATPILNGIWTEVSPGISGSFNSVVYTNDSTAFIAGSTGIILKTTDGGNNWIAKNSGTTNQLFCIKFYDELTGYAVGALGTILKTEDGGENWVKLISNISTTINSVYIKSANEIWAAGASGVVLHSENAGLSWIKTIVDDVISWDIKFISDKTGFLCGTLSNIYRTIDGGNSWTKMNISSTTTSLYSMSFINSQIGYAVGSGGSLMKTDDGGTNWYKAIGDSVYSNYFIENDYYTGYGDVFDIRLAIIKNITFTTTEIGYMTGYVGGVQNCAFILKTINGGKTWKLISKYDTKKLNSAGFYNSNNGIVAGISGFTVKLSAVTSSTGTYHWSPSTGLSNPDIKNPIANPTETTTYTVDYADGDCSASASVTVNVEPLQVYPMSNKTVICDGSVVLNEVRTNYIGPDKLKYKWTPSTGLDSDTIQNPTATVSSTIIYTVEVSTQSGSKATGKVTVQVANLSINVGSNYKSGICGDFVQLDSILTNYTNSSKLHYKWTPSDGLNSDTIANPIVHLSQSTRYNVRLTTDAGCTVGSYVQVNVNPLSANAGNDLTTICNQPIQLNTPITNQTGNNHISYKWSPSEFIDNDTLANPIAKVTNNTKFTVTVSTSGGCSATDSIMVNVVTMDKPAINVVSINENNKNTISWSKNEEDKIQYYKIYKETNQTDQYQLIGTRAFDSTGVYVDTLSLPDVQSNKYRISIIDDCGNETAMSDYHKTMHLAINKGVNNSWNLIWEPYIGFNVATYNIYRGSKHDDLQQIGSLSGSNTQFSDFSAQTNNVYYRIDAVSLSTSSAPKQNANVGIMKAIAGSSLVSESNIATNVGETGFADLLDFSDLITLFPNPAKDKVELTIDREFEQNMNMKIFNLLGTVVSSEKINSNKQQIDIHSLNSGIYILVISTDSFMAKQRLVIK